MRNFNKLAVFLKFIFIVFIVIVLSIISTKIWNEKPEAGSNSGKIVYDPDITIAEFGKINNLPNPVLKKVFGLNTKNDLNKKLNEINISQEETLLKLKKELALSSERESKNWIKILIKFGLWLIFLTIIFFLLRQVKLNNSVRIILYSVSVLVFGIILGADPGPMGTIKDAIAHFGKYKTIFLPRIIAFSVFFILVFAANKFICAWGCQAGVLQDLIFRLNRNNKDKPIIKQFKIPFFISNSIRIAFFLIFTSITIFTAFDIIEPVDPFKIYKPQMIGIIGGFFIGFILISSLFIYRPWCHFFCPFGLAGWLVEKISVFKITVNYDKCIACEKCTESCPSTVMNTILKRKKIIADCFSCGSCITVCPVNAISFKPGKRQLPPENKFL